MAILIVGGDSSLGKCYIKHCEDNKLKFKYTSRRKTIPNDVLYFDLKNLNFEVFNDYSFDFVIFFASVCNQDFCENNREESYLINVENTQKSLQVFSKISKRILFISSNTVFDGKQSFMSFDDETNPINEYGRQKLEVEKWISINLSNVSILRLSKVIHPYLKLITDWKKNLDQQKEIYPYLDLYLSPIPIKDVLKKIECIRSNNEDKIYHCKSSQDISYYEYALKIFDNHPNKEFIKKGTSNNSNSNIIFSSLK